MGYVLHHPDRQVIHQLKYLHPMHPSECHDDLIHNFPIPFLSPAAILETKPKECLKYAHHQAQPTFCFHQNVHV
ncbi:hypothetical protein CF65_02949 [Aggregatibacter actinomycetemcomitans HK1651]|nr:hypothetical protein CF65_02949 [Aggregatibacter actinomycetemcomitans HK1651]